MKPRHVIEYAALRAALWVFSCLPVDTASSLGGRLFETLGPAMGIGKTARRNLARCFPDWPAARVDQTIKGMWNNLGRIVAEYPHLEAIAKSDRVAFRNVEKFEDIAKSGRPAILVSGHLGNWELLPPALLFRCGLPLHSVYRAPNNPLVDRLLVNLRGLDGRLRSFGKNRRGLAETLRALEAGQTVGMLIDQKMNTGIEARFFGRPAMTGTAFVELAKKLDCPVVPGRIIRTQACRFEIELEDPLIVKDRETQAVVADMHTRLERWITENPAQWLWLHRRWKD